MAIQIIEAMKDYKKHTKLIESISEHSRHDLEVFELFEKRIKALEVSVDYLAKQFLKIIPDELKKGNQIVQ